MKGSLSHLNFRPLRTSKIYEQVNRDVPLARKELKYLCSFWPRRNISEYKYFCSFCSPLWTSLILYKIIDPHLAWPAVNVRVVLVCILSLFSFRYGELKTRHTYTMIDINIFLASPCSDRKITHSSSAYSMPYTARLTFGSSVSVPGVVGSFFGCTRSLRTYDSELYPCRPLIRTAAKKTLSSDDGESTHPSSCELPCLHGPQGISTQFPHSLRPFFLWSALVVASFHLCDTFLVLHTNGNAWCSSRVIMAPSWWGLNLSSSARRSPAPLLSYLPSTSTRPPLVFPRFDPENLCYGSAVWKAGDDTHTGWILSETALSSVEVLCSSLYCVPVLYNC